jgi:hypothetical protein
MNMRLRVETKLRKALRRAEQGLPGLQAAVAGFERRGAAFPEALCRLAADLAEPWEFRRFVAILLWTTAGTKDVWLAMVQLVANAGNTSVVAAYISLWRDRKSIHASELKLFRRMLICGSPEEQRIAVERVAFIRCRPVRRALIDIVDDVAAPLEVRECATEMLHVHGCRETAEACANALHDQHASIRFWATYTLGEIPAFRDSLREVAASILERAINDTEVASGWWSVGREAQAAIANLRGDGEQERLQAEIQAVCYGV